MTEVVRRVAAGSTTSAERSDYYEGLAAIGLLPPGTDILELLAAGAPDTVAGLYDPVDRRLYVAREAPESGALDAAGWLLQRDLDHEIPLVHEVIHAIQHELHPELFEAHFALSHDDFGYAIAAAYEGHATWFGMLALEIGEPPPVDEMLDALRSGVANGDPSSLPGAPAVVRAALFFPYAAGYRLAAVEGHELLDAPPISTEQALHPERRSEPFTAIDLAPARDRLPADCAFVHENGVGELGIGMLLTENGAPQDDASFGSVPAAEGWDGDRYLAARCGERRGFVWVTQWDDEAEAIEFETAYRAIAHDARGATPVTRRSERSVLVASPDLAEFAMEIGAAARRARVATLSEYRRFWGPLPAAPGGGAAP